jgi:hypothetical protein
MTLSSDDERDSVINIVTHASHVDATLTVSQTMAGSSAQLPGQLCFTLAEGDPIRKPVSAMTIKQLRYVCSENEVSCSRDANKAELKSTVVAWMTEEGVDPEEELVVPAGPGDIRARRAAEGEYSAIPSTAVTSVTQSRHGPLPAIVPVGNLSFSSPSPVGRAVPPTFLGLQGGAPTDKVSLLSQEVGELKQMVATLIANQQSPAAATTSLGPAQYPGFRTSGPPHPPADHCGSPLIRGEATFYNPGQYSQGFAVTSEQGADAAARVGVLGPSHTEQFNHRDKHIAAALRGEYVKLVDFLPPTREVEEPEGMLILPNGQVSLQSRRKRSIDSFEAWSEAYNQLEHVVVSAFPAKFPEFSLYRQIIHRAAKSFTWSAVAAFDVRHRMQVATTPGKKFQEIDVALYAQVLNSTVAKIQGACYSCGANDHMARNCPFAADLPQQQRGPPFRNKDRPASVGSGQGRFGPRQDESAEICNNWNREACNYRMCKRLHICKVCRGNHPSTRCPRSQGPGSQPRM